MSERRVERAMRRLAEDKTQRNRFAVYSALLSCELIVPLQPGQDAPTGLPLPSTLARDGEDAAAGPFVVFTDPLGLPRWRKGGGPRVRIAGTLLFPLLAEARAEALLINPSGRVGGMLYGHEIMSIAEAAMRRSPSA